MVILMGDFNAKIGKQDCQKQVIGPHTLHDAINENGNMLIQLATRKINYKKYNVPTQAYIFRYMEDTRNQ